MPARFDILGIGNAIVDVVTQVDDVFLSRHDMHKGSMTLIDSDAADTLYAAMPAGHESSGGSAANTCAVAAAMVARIRAFTSMPIALGFGISRPEHVAQVGAYADAAVVGSALVSLIASESESPSLLARVEEYVRSLKGCGLPA